MTGVVCALMAVAFTFAAAAPPREDGGLALILGGRGEGPQARDVTEGRDDAPGPTRQRGTRSRVACAPSTARKPGSSTADPRTCVTGQRPRSGIACPWNADYSPHASHRLSAA